MAVSPRVRSRAYVGKDNQGFIWELLGRGAAQYGSGPEIKYVASDDLSAGLGGNVLGALLQDIGLVAAEGQANICPFFFENKYGDQFNYSAGQLQSSLLPQCLQDFRLRVFARDEESMRHAWPHILDAQVSICNISAPVILGLLMCKYFDMKGVEDVDVFCEEVTEDLPEPFLAYALRARKLMKTDGLSPSRWSTPPDFFVDHDVIKDILLFHNFGLLHAGLFVSGNTPINLLVSEPLHELMTLGRVHIALQSNRVFPARDFGSHTLPVLTATSLVHTIMCDKRETVRLSWSHPIVGICVSVSYADPFDADKEAPKLTSFCLSADELPISTGVSLDEESVDMIVGSTRVYLVNFSGALLEDKKALFHAWFIDRCGINSSRIETLTTTIVHDHDELLSVSFSGVQANMLRFVELMCGLCYQGQNRHFWSDPL